MVPAKRSAPLVGILTDKVLEAGTVNPVSRMLLHLEATAAETCA